MKELMIFNFIYLKILSPAGFYYYFLNYTIIGDLLSTNVFGRNKRGRAIPVSSFTIHNIIFQSSLNKRDISIWAGHLINGRGTP